MKTLYLAALMAGVASGAMAADLPTHKSPLRAGADVYAARLHLGRSLCRYQRRLRLRRDRQYQFRQSERRPGRRHRRLQLSDGPVRRSAARPISIGPTSAPSNTFTNFAYNNYHVNAMTTERLRLGYAVDRALFYVTGGYAGVSTHASIADNFNGVYASRRTTGAAAAWSAAASNTPSPTTSRPRPNISGRRCRTRPIGPARPTPRPTICRFRWRASASTSSSDLRKRASVWKTPAVSAGVFVLRPLREAPLGAISLAAVEVVMQLWDAKTYDRFEAERARPSRELIARIPVAPKRIVDLGCGSGLSTLALREAFPESQDRRRRFEPGYARRRRQAASQAIFREGDAATFDASGFDLVFANAVFHWVPDHLQRLAASGALRCREGGCLAVQMPDNEQEPSHRLMREIAASAGVSRARAAADRASRSAALANTMRRCRPPCDWVDIWRTTYVHRVGSPDDIVKWVEGAGLGPISIRSTPARRAAYLAAYREAVAEAYPAQTNGAILFPFPRLFIVARARRVNEALSRAPLRSSRNVARPAHAPIPLRRSLSSAALVVGAIGAGQGHARAEAAAAARTSRRSAEPGQTSVRPQMTPTEAQTRSIGFYSHGCLAGAQAAAARRRHLARHAHFAQPLLGQSGDDRFSRAILEESGRRRGLAGHSRRRHLAAARRPDDNRPRLASDSVSTPISG